MRARKWLRRIIVLWIVTGLFAVISMFRPPVLCIGTRAIALMDGRIVMVFADRPLHRLPDPTGAEVRVGNVVPGMTLIPGPVWLPHWINSSASIGTNSTRASSFNAWWIWVPLPPLLILLAVIAPVLYILSRRFPGKDCRRCGYNLTGNTSGRCP